MNRKIATFTLALFATATGALWWLASNPTTQANIADLIEAPETAMQLNLGSLGASEVNGSSFQYTSSENYYAASGAYSHLEQIRHKKPDGGVVIDYFSADSGASIKLFTLVYAPAQSATGSPPLAESISFKPDGSTISRDIVFDATTGKRLHSSEANSDGSYTDRIFYDDGASIYEEAVIGTDPNGITGAVLSSKHYLPDGTLTVSSILNSDESRTVTLFGTKGLPLSVTKTGFNGETVGETVVMYYPDTNNIEVSSVTDEATTNAEVFRPDGTLEYKWVITCDGSYSWAPSLTPGQTSQLVQMSFDATGKIAEAESDFSASTFYRNTTYGIEIDTANWVLKRKVEKFSDGKETGIPTGITHNETILNSSINLPIPNPFIDFQ